MREQWRNVAGTSGHYEVSNLGRVRSIDRTINNRTYKGKVLTGTKNRSGHLAVNLSGRRDYIHRLVLETFVGPQPDGMECRHLDGNPENNRLSNLRWGTPFENSTDKGKHGTQYHKLNPNQVRAIRKEYKEMYPKSQRKLASKYGVCLRTIQLVLNRDTWKNV